MNQADIKDFAQKAPLFKGLTEREIQAVCTAMISRTFNAGEVIVHEDDNESQTFFILVSGTVHVCVYTNEGKQTILATLRRGDFFGEMSILDGEPRSASVAAAEKCELFMLYRKPFLDLLQQYPKIAIQMLVEMSRRLRKTNRHVNTLSLMSVYGRVAEVILQLAKEHGRRSGAVIVIPDRPTHQQIADMTGASRETVSRILSQLQKKHYIAIDRKQMIILDEKKLYD